MDEIAEQLRAEIRSLEEHIRQTEGRFLASHWTGQLIDPFERVEDQLDDDDLRAAVAAFRHARTRFQVNGRLAERIDRILERHAGLAPTMPKGSGADYAQVVLADSGDPADGGELDEAGSLFLEEDEEVGAAAGDPELALEPEAPAGPAANAASQTGADDLFAEPDDRRDLAVAAPTPGPAPGAAPPAVDRSRPSTLARDAQSSELHSTFAHAVSLDDLSAGLDIVIPQPDRADLENKLRARMSDPVVAALQSRKMAEGQYILLPRVARFASRDGEVVPCTVKNLARRYIALFGEIRDLMRYRNDPMMSSQVPEPGWAVITAEAPRESLNKTYMEQNQYLRYLATSLGIPSHLLRRRTLVETLYDLLVGKLVLGRRLQRATLDWTASSPAKSDFVCLYYPEEGIRLRDLSRTTHHPSLGVTPNW